MSNPNAANQEIRQALQQVLTAADQIGNAPEHPRSPTHVRHDETQQGLILQAWEKLALLTGNHDLARESGFEIPQPDMPNTGGLSTGGLSTGGLSTGGLSTGGLSTGGLSTGALSAAWIELQRNQPVIPLHQLRDPFQAMGTAMCHIGSATLQYGLIQDLPSRCGNAERYLRAENDARIAHAILHRTYTYLASSHPRGPEIRKHCRLANLWLTRDRSRAARALGIDPPPEPSDDLQHGEMDWDRRDARDNKS